VSFQDVQSMPELEGDLIDQDLSEPQNLEDQHDLSIRSIDQGDVQRFEVLENGVSSEEAEIETSVFRIVEE